MNYYFDDPIQRQLRVTQRGLGIVFLWAIRLLIYSPLVATGYLICTLFLSKQANGILWLGLPLVFGLLIFFALVALKRLLLSLKAKESGWWILLFICCVAFTCILPTYLLYHPLNSLILRLHGNRIVTAVLLACFALYVYFHYDFLNHTKRI